MTPILVVALLILGLEACRALWHGDQCRKHPLPVLGHVLCAAALGYLVHPIAGPLALLLVWPSYAVWPRPGEVPSGWWRKPLRKAHYTPSMREKGWRRSRPWSDRAHVLSALSSWPVELAAIAAVTAPLWGQWPQFAGACALWLAVAALCKWAIWRNPWLRPSHWR